MAENNDTIQATTTSTMAEQTQRINNTYLWKMLSPTGVSPLMKRRCHSAVVLGTSLYLFGGYVEETRCSSDLFVLDLIKQEWKELTTQGEAPSARAYHAACFVGRKMLVIGGASYSRVRNMEVHALNIDTLTWSQYMIPEGQPQPPVRCGHRVFALGKFFFMLGGSDDDTYFNDFWAFDTELGTWTQMFPAGIAPPPRNSFTLNLVGEDLYVFGGQIAGRLETNDFYKLNLPSLHWSKLYEFRRGRRRPRNEDGGEIEASDEEEETNNNNNDNTNGAPASSSTPAQNPLGSSSAGMTDSRGRKKIVIPPPRADHAGITVNKKIYMFGGFTGVYPNSVRYRDMYCYDTETEEWRLVTEHHGEIPFGMSGHTLSQYGSQMVLLGGFAGSYETINDNVYKLELPQSDLTLMELCIQTIREKQLYTCVAAAAAMEEPGDNPADEKGEESDSSCSSSPSTSHSAACKPVLPSVRLPLDLEEKLVF